MRYRTSSTESKYLPAQQKKKKRDFRVQNVNKPAAPTCCSLVSYRSSRLTSCRVGNHQLPSNNNFRICVRVRLLITIRTMTPRYFMFFRPRSTKPIALSSAGYPVTPFLSYHNFFFFFFYVSPGIYYSIDVPAIRYFRILSKQHHYRRLSRPELYETSIYNAPERIVVTRRRCAQL